MQQHKNMPADMQAEFVQHGDALEKAACDFIIKSSNIPSAPVCDATVMP